MSSFFVSGVDSWAQTKPTASTDTAPETAPAKTEKTVELSHVIVEGSSDEQQLPNVPSRSIYGLAETPQETPRGLVQISAAQLQSDPIYRIEDLARYSPSVGQMSGQDSAPTPYVRGLRTEAYENGQRVLNRVTGVPLNFNNVESVDLVRGPSSIVFGPSSNTGGFINYTTKRPYFDRNHTTARFDFGRLVSGGAGFSELTWNIDNGGPIIPDKLAYRVSYTQADSDSYYHNAYRKYYTIYGALTYNLSKKVSLDLTFDHGRYDYYGPYGWSRVTQDLIDNSTYIAGPSTPIIRNVTGGQLYSPINPNNPAEGYVTRVLDTTAGYRRYLPGATTANFTPAGAGTIVGYVLDPRFTYKTKLQGSQTSIAPGDQFKDKTFKGQARLTAQINDDLAIVSSFLGNSSLNTRDSGDSYKYLNDEWVVENRTEFQLSKRYSLFGQNIVHDSNSGFSVRYENAQDILSSNLGLSSQYDLAGPDGDFRLSRYYGTAVPVGLGYPTQISGISRFGVPLVFSGVYAVPDYPNLYAQAGGSPGGGGSINSTTGDSKWTESGIFTQQNLKIGKYWALNAGVRTTYVDAKIWNPILSPYLPNGGVLQADATAWQTSYNGSLLFRPAQWVNTYFTYDHTIALNNNIFGTGLVWSPAGNTLAGENFQSKSRLLEAGAKFTIVPNRLYADVAFFDQKRDQPAATSNTPGVYNIAELRVKGVEFSVQYQPNRQFLLGANASYLDSTLFNALGISQGASPNGFVADNGTVFNDNNALNATPNRTLVRFPTPRIGFATFTKYTFANGFGLRADLQYFGSHPQNYRADPKVVNIPASYQLNVSAIYERERWTAQVDFLNVTNQTLFSYPTALGAGEYAQKLEPFSVKGSIRFRY